MRKLVQDRPSFQELVHLIYVKKNPAVSLHIQAKIDIPFSIQYFPATLKLLTMCMKPVFLSTLIEVEN